MKYYVYSSLFNTICSLICCVFVYLSQNKSKSSKYFFLFALSVALWSTSYFIWLKSPNKEFALFYIRLLNLFALFIPVTFFHFCCHLLNKYNKLKKILIAFYLLDLLILPFTFSPLYIKGVAPIDVFSFWPKPGPIYILLPLEYLALISISLTELYKKLSSANNLNEKRMLQFVFYGLVLGFLGGATNFLFTYHILLPPIGNVLVSFYTFGITYAIFKYQFMNITA